MERPGIPPPVEIKTRHHPPDDMAGKAEGSKAEVEGAIPGEAHTVGPIDLPGPGEDKTVLGPTRWEASREPRATGGAEPAQAAAIPAVTAEDKKEGLTADAATQIAQVNVANERADSGDRELQEEGKRAEQRDNADLLLGTLLVDDRELEEMGEGPEGNRQLLDRVRSHLRVRPLSHDELTDKLLTMGFIKSREASVGEIARSFLEEVNEGRIAIPDIRPLMVVVGPQVREEFLRQLSPEQREEVGEYPTEGAALENHLRGGSGSTPDATGGVGSKGGSPDGPRPRFRSTADFMRDEGIDGSRSASVAERMRRTFEDLDKGKFAAGLINAINPRTEGGKTFWYSTLTAATIAGIRTAAVHAGVAEMGEVGVVVVGAMAGGLKDGITEAYFRSKDKKKAVGAALAGAIIGGVTAAVGYNSADRPSGLDHMIASGVMGLGSAYLRKVSSGEWRNIFTTKGAIEIGLSAVMAGGFTGLADLLIPRPEVVESRGAEPAAVTSPVATMETGRPGGAVVTPTVEAATNTPTPTAIATETATNTPTPTKTPEAVAAVVTETPTNTPTAQPIPTQEVINGIPSATPTTSVDNDNAVSPITPVVTSTPTLIPTSISTPVVVTSTPTAEAVMPTATPESAARGAGSTWDSIKDWWGNLGRGAPSQDEYGNPVVGRPGADDVPGDNTISGDNGDISGEVKPNTTSASYVPRPEDVQVLSPDYPSASVGDATLDRDYVLVRPGENYDSSLGHKPGSMYVAVDSNPPIETPGVEGQRVPSGMSPSEAGASGGSEPSASGDAGVNPPAGAPEAPAGAGSEGGAGGGSEVSEAAGSIEQAVANFDKEIPLPKDSTPWAVAEQLLKEANPNGEFTPAQIMEVDKVLCEQNDIAVPEWGIEGKVLASRLPAGTNLKITDEVKQAVIAAAGK